MRAEGPLTHLWRIVKLIIGFQGTRYEGWQSQRKDKTLQELFEKILLKIFKEKIHLTSSSRTDSGVHALGLAAHFKVHSKLSDERIQQALNFYLPPDVVVQSAQTVPDAFHARFGAKSKQYRYDIWNSATRPLFEAPFVLWVPHKLDAVAMTQAASFFKGRHDFSAFQADGGEENRNAVRTITKITVKKTRERIRIDIEGDGFLRYMVRIIVGTLLEVGRRKITPSKIRQILKSRDRSKAGPTVKALGLTLVKVKY